MQTGGIFYIHPAFERQSLANDIGGESRITAKITFPMPEIPAELKLF